VGSEVRESSSSIAYSTSVEARRCQNFLTNCTATVFEQGCEILGF
jgi:hypothetical protein